MRTIEEVRDDAEHTERLLARVRRLLDVAIRRGDAAAQRTMRRSVAALEGTLAVQREDVIDLEARRARGVALLPIGNRAVCPACLGLWRHAPPIVSIEAVLSYVRDVDARLGHLVPELASRCAACLDVMRADLAAKTAAASHVTDADLDRARAELTRCGRDLEDELARLEHPREAQRTCRPINAPAGGARKLER